MVFREIQDAQAWADVLVNNGERVRICKARLDGKPAWEVWRV
jgi:hypothetical protein